MPSKTIIEISEQIRSAGLSADQIPGGIADEKSPDDFDPNALRKGISVEMEHTNDEAVAREIAMDHLTEDPAYYDKLEQVGLRAGVDPKALSRWCALPRAFIDRQARRLMR